MRKLKWIAFLMLLILFMGGCGSPKSDADIKSDVNKSQDIATIAVPSVVDENILVAIHKMEESGFINVSSNINEYDGWDKEKLIVVAQSVAAGTQVSADTSVELTCKRICKLYLDLKSETN